MPIDPVCGMDVDADASETSEFEGHTYFFCTRDCKEDFDESPEEYVGREGDAGLERTGTS